MRIVCPHCTTSYAIDLSTLGGAGRTVRCSRCKETWLARPEDAVAAAALVPAMAEAGGQAGSGNDATTDWDALAREESEGQETPVVDSPSISGDWPSQAGEGAPQAGGTDWLSMARHDGQDSEASRPQRPSGPGRFWRPAALFGARGRSVGGQPLVSLPTACTAMGALVLALMIWRVDVVRLLPQTAGFYRMVGLDVNLRGLVFKDVKISSETVEGKPVLVIEGVIVGETSKPVELPRLRFSVRDAQGAEIYAWNAVLEQPVLKPGEKAWFKSRLASPPPEGRHIDVRFFSRRDIAGGSV
jgi:predicted Zn finger-like uncharacterized protein